MADETTAPANAEDEKAEPKPATKPEHGADSQLRCYNATSWRLDQLFETDEEASNKS